MEIQTELNNTVVMIIHDVDEAALLSDRIVMMTNGPATGVDELFNIDLKRPHDRPALAKIRFKNKHEEQTTQLINNNDINDLRN